jgi:hypothetical protein
MSNGWILYDPTKETKTELLTTEEAQFIILRLKTKSLEDYLVKRDDWPQWKKLNIFLESPESPFMNTVPLVTEKEEGAAPKPKVTSDAGFSSVRLENVKIEDAFGDHKQQFDGDQLSQDSTKSPAVNFSFKNLNKANAFSPKKNSDDAFKIELLLIHPNGEMLRTVASEISLTGTFCDKLIPGSFHNGNFDVIVINNVINDDEVKRLTLKGKIVVTDSKTYIQFINMTEEQKNALRAGLDYYMRTVKKFKKENS